MPAGKEQRQALIRRLVRRQAIASQQELRAALRAAHCDADQPTVSRDLAELGIRKIAGRYRQNGTHSEPAGAVDLASAVRGFVVCGPHLIVVRTETGQAQPVAVVIDSHGDPSITATLAGDDTIFVATRNRRTQTVALRRLATWFGEKNELG